jgi:hypothetical protein
MIVLALSGILLAAASAKLLDLWGIRLTVRELLSALPRGLTHLLAILVVALEFTAAGALIVLRSPFALVGSIATAMLAISFAVAFLLARRLPYPIACHCFGRLGRSNLSRRTLAIAALMMAGAILVATDSHAGNIVEFSAYQLRLCAVLPALFIVAAHLRQRSESVATGPRPYHTPTNGSRP